MRRRIAWILATILLTAVTIVSIAIWWPINDSHCNAEAFLASNIEKYQVQAIKVVAKPWTGAHNIYAIFLAANLSQRFAGSWQDRGLALI